MEINKVTMIFPFIPFGIEVSPHGTHFPCESWHRVYKPDVFCKLFQPVSSGHDTWPVGSDCDVDRVYFPN